MDSQSVFVRGFGGLRKLLSFRHGHEELGLWDLLRGGTRFQSPASASSVCVAAGVSETLEDR